MLGAGAEIPGRFECRWSAALTMRQHPFSYVVMNAEMVFVVVGRRMGGVA
jgi:hypothetical protein